LTFHWWQISSADARERPYYFLPTFETDRVITTRTATRSCQTRKRAVHVYSPGVAALRRSPPLLPLLLQLQLLLLLLLHSSLLINN